MAQMIKRNTGQYIRIAPDNPAYLEYGYDPNDSQWHKLSTNFGCCFDLTTNDGGKTIEANTSKGVFIAIGGVANWSKK